MMFRRCGQAGGSRHGLNFPQMPKEGAPVLSNPLAQRWGRKGKDRRVNLEKAFNSQRKKERESGVKQVITRPPIYISSSSDLVI